jgi:Flp pilus assembly secretin CpaC
MLEVSLTKLRDQGISTTWFSNGYVSEADLEQLTGGTRGQSDSSADKSQTEQLNDSLQFVNWLRQENLAKTLADPTVLVVSGQPASLHVGGEFPIPNNSGAKPELGFRRFGTELKVMALAVGDNQVRLEYKTRVSEIDQSHALQVDGEQVPGLRVREFDSGCQLSFGQTAIMAGLVQKRVEAQERADGQAVQELVEVGLMVVITPELIQNPELSTDNEARSIRESLPVAQR